MNKIKEIKNIPYWIFFVLALSFATQITGVFFYQIEKATTTKLQKDEWTCVDWNKTECVVYRKNPDK